MTPLWQRQAVRGQATTAEEHRATAEKCMDEARRIRRVNPDSPAIARYERAATHHLAQATRMTTG